MAIRFGHGVTLNVYDAPPDEGGTPTAVTQVRGVALPGWQRDVEDVALHDRAPGTLVPKIASALMNPTEIELEILFDPQDATHAKLFRAPQTREPIWVSFTHNGNLVNAFDAWVTRFEVESIPANNGFYTARVTIVPAGITTTQLAYAGMPGA